MDYNFLCKTPLFQGILPKELEAMQPCLNLTQKKYKKQEIIFHAGNLIKKLGIVRSGSVCVEYVDIWGNKSILGQFGMGQVFGESYAFAPATPLMVNIVANTDAEIVLMDAQSMLQFCGKACSYHSRLIQNLLMISSQKNIGLTRKIFHTSAKSIRSRLLSYLSFEVTQQGSYAFYIRYNRQQLADYLNVDRSALSNEISKMQKEGILSVHKNHFSVLDTAVLQS